uniref:SPARK domain-containing protein n=1 Tax=Davidia involucrata TaxID=16924 RepID=A0A5B7ABC9_DAVIN
MLNFAAIESVMSMTSIDCLAVFAPFLANVICCPQLEATLVILLGQSSKDTNMLALNGTLAKHCLSDFNQILVGQGASDNLQQICSIRPSNLTEGSCPVKDVNEFESTVDSSKLLAACEKIDLVKECCGQICLNAISEAARKLALKAYGLLSIVGSHTLSDHSTRVNDCKSIVLRWLASKLDPSHAKEVLRGLSNCNVNKGELGVKVKLNFSYSLL